MPQLYGGIPLTYTTLIIILKLLELPSGQTGRQALGVLSITPCLSPVHPGPMLCNPQLGLMAPCAPDPVLYLKKTTYALKTASVVALPFILWCRMYSLSQKFRTFKQEFFSSLPGGDFAVMQWWTVYNVSYSIMFKVSPPFSGGSQKIHITIKCAKLLTSTVLLFKTKKRGKK